MSSFIKHLLFAVIPSVICGYVFCAAQSMPNSARLLPQAMSALTFILTGVMVLNAWRDEAAKGEQSKSALFPPYALRCTLYAAGIGIYIFCIEPLGYFPATAFFMLLSFLLLRSAGFVKTLVITVVFTVFIYLLFICFLKLPVPLGMLELLQAQ